MPPKAATVLHFSEMAILKSFNYTIKIRGPFLKMRKRAV